MKSGFRFTMFIALAVVCATTGFAQLNQLNQPNATMMINGMDPGIVDPAKRDVQVKVPGVLAVLTTSTNPLVPFILTASLVDPCVGGTTALDPLPWGDSFEIGTANGSNVPSNVQVIGDGTATGTINNLFFTLDGGQPTLGLDPQSVWAVGASENLHNSHVAFQVVAVDPTNPPFNLRNSSAASCSFIIGQFINAITGDDGNVNVPLINGNSFAFHGGSYNSVNVHGNGYVTFGAPNGVGFAVDPIGFANQSPAIAGVYADWNSGATGIVDGVLFEECGTTLRVAWGDPATNSFGGIQHFATADANMFDITMELNTTNPALMANPNAAQFTVKTTVLDTSGGAVARSGLFGHTPGTNSTAAGAVALNPASVFDRYLLANNGVVGGPGDAMIEVHDLDGNTNAIGLDADVAGSGVFRAYANAAIWSGNGVAYIPLDPTGAAGYLGTACGPVAKDVVGIAENVIDLTGGTVSLIGKWENVDLTTAVLTWCDPDGSVVAVAGNAAALGIKNSGNVTTMNPGADLLNPAPSTARDGECLSVLIPASTITGNGTLKVDCDGDGVNEFSFDLLVTMPGINVSCFMLNDDDGINGAFTLTSNTVNMYGNMHSAGTLNSNGQITFGTGTGDFSASVAEFDSGWQGGGLGQNNGIAVAYHDMNSGGMASGATFKVIEDTITGKTTFQYLNQNHWSGGGGGEPMGDVSVCFDGAQFSFDYSAYIPAVTETEVVIYGLTDGDETAGAATDQSANPTGLIGYSSSGAGAALPDSPFVQGAANAAHVGSGFLPGDYNSTGLFFALEAAAGDWLFF